MKHYLHGDVSLDKMNDFMEFSLVLAFTFFFLIIPVYVPPSASAHPHDLLGMLSDEVLIVLNCSLKNL